MNIFSELQAIRKALLALRPVAGEGIVVQRNPRGFIISAEEQDASDDGESSPSTMGVEISGSNVVVSAGTVHVGTTVTKAFAGGTVSASAGFLWLEVSQSGTPSLHVSASRPAFYDSSTGKFQLSIANIELQDGVWSVAAVLHSGDFYLPFPPEWIAGYSAAAVQLLGHDATGSLYWYTPATCDE